MDSRHHALPYPSLESDQINKGKRKTQRKAYKKKHTRVRKTVGSLYKDTNMIHIIQQGRAGKTNLRGQGSVDGATDQETETAGTSL